VGRPSVWGISGETSIVDTGRLPVGDRRDVAGMIGLLREASWLTAARVRRFATVFLVAMLAVVAWDFSAHTSNGVTDGNGEHLARDFVGFWATARVALRHEPVDVYDVDALSAEIGSLVGPVSERIDYPYPPMARLLMAPLGALGYVPALAAWILLGTALNVLVMRRDLDTAMSWLAALAAPAVLLNTLSGQAGQFVAALFGGGILLLDRRPFLSGVLFGALCWKPQLGILIPVALAAGGRWRCFLGAAVTTAVLIAGTFALWGAETWVSFFRQAERVREFMGVNTLMWHRLPTVFAASRIAGLGVGAAYALQILSAVAAAVCVSLVWRRSIATPIKGAALIVAVFLATPYCWDYDMVVVTLAVVWAAHEGIRTGFLPWERILLALLMLLPLIMDPIASLTRVGVAPFVLWGVLALLVRRALLAAPALESRPAVP
jgi:hypothetical protein